MNILVVEDSSSDRELLIFTLQEHFQEEAHFREAATLKDAHSYLERGNVDCIILDLQLPDSAGLDTFLRVYTAYPQIPIIIATHNANLELARQLVRAGAEDVILKNFTHTTAIFRRILLATERTARNRKRLMAL